MTALEVARDITVIATGLAAWVVGLYKYKKSREAESAIQIDVEVDARPADLVNLVQVIIHIRNVGRAAAFIGHTEQAEAAICRIRKIIAPAGSSPIAWDSKFTEDLIPAINYFSSWLDYGPGEPMIFEPSSGETFRVVFSTDHRGPIWVHVELVDSDEYKYTGDALFTLT